MVVLELVNEHGEAVNIPVEFEYSYEDEKPRDTYCRILDNDRDNDHPPTVLGMGAACLHHNDQFNRAKGRKLAFSRALDDAKITNKDLRTLYWDAYKSKMRVE